jgi:predicted AAA+ superfamily ATPase
MKDQRFTHRAILPRVLESLEDSPVLLIHGPRQSGKTTLTKHVGEKEGYVYMSFDQDIQRSAAKADPVGFVAELPDRVILDEVQRVPELFTSIKMAVDENRTPGRFILTGSANVLFVPALSDSLAGRISFLRLHPFSQAEIEGNPSPLLDHLMQGGFRAGQTGRRLGRELAERITTGGFPPVLTRASPRRKADWYRDYIETLIQRDIRDLANISSLEALPRLLTMAAGQTSRLINITELAAPFQLSRPTIREYLTLLSRMFLLEETPSWHHNRLKRLIKTAKLHMGDTGLACALLNVDTDRLWEDRPLFGQLLETFVFQELRRLAGAREERIVFSHFRDKDQTEVDVVMEWAGRVAGVEVKASSTVTADDFKGLKRFQQLVGDSFAYGLVLYDGDAVVPFGPSLYAVPISSLWE